MVTNHPDLFNGLLQMNVTGHVTDLIVQSTGKEKMFIKQVI